MYFLLQIKTNKYKNGIYDICDTLIERYLALHPSRMQLVRVITETLYNIFIFRGWIVLLFINITTVQHYIFISRNSLIILELFLML